MDRGTRPGTRRLDRHVLTPLLTLALVLSMAVSPGTLAQPAAAATPTLSCPGALVPATAFTDTLTTSHRVAIDCAAWWGITTGVSATRYAPGRQVTRAQTAAMVHRLLEAGDRDLPDAVPARFADTGGHTFEAEIGALAELGVLQGVTAERFAPDTAITRAQMASVLTAGIELGFGVTLPSARNPFTDVAASSPHHDAVASLFAAGIAAGTSATTFTPGRAVNRAQMASFVTRVAVLLEDDGYLTLPEARPGADDAYADRMRAAWVHLFDDALKTRAGIRRMVDELVAADATAVIAQVARRHDAYYRSEVLTRTVDPRLEPGLDVLAELIDVAHAAGLEVHAWYGIAPTWHRVYEDLPAPSGWLTREHGAEAPVAQRWVTRTHTGRWSDYLDPGVPEVQTHVREVVEELARDYEVDGIHLDYVRYPSADHGYNPKALASFRAATGRSDTPAPSDAQWSTWRREQSRELVRAAAEGIARSGRDVVLSAAVITWGDAPVSFDRAEFRASSPYTRTLQDWDQWVRDGELDVVLPMNYFRQTSSDPRHAQHPTWFAQWQAYQRGLAAVSPTRIVPGPGGYLNTPEDARAQVRSSMRTDGAAVYSYQQPTLDGSRDIWGQLANTRWGYHPSR